MAQYKPVDTSTEAQALVYLARGDTAGEISKALGISVPTVGNIKKRNADTLLELKNKILQHNLTESTKILEKANKILSRKLEWVEVDEAKRRELDNQLLNNKIPREEYNKEIENLSKASISEITAVTREMNSQIKAAESDPAHEASSDGQNKVLLKELADALNSGDEVVLERLIFNPPSEEAHEAS